MADNHFKINRGISLVPQTSQPSNGADGDIYYDSSLSKFRKYQNGAWSDLDTAGSGGGTGDDLNNLTYRVSIAEDFSQPLATSGIVDTGAGKTDSNLFSLVNTYFRLAYDASRTVTGTGTAMTLSATPAFTIKAGDVLVVGTQVRRITSITSQTVFAIDAAFSANPAASACCVSQAVHTVDLNNFAGDGIAASAAISTALSEVLIDYEDTTTNNDTILDVGTPNVAFSVSADGSNWTSPQARPSDLTSQLTPTGITSTGTNFYLRFFANKSSGSGSINLLAFKAYWHPATSQAYGAFADQALGFTDSSATPSNCTISTVGGKTRITLGFNYVMGVNPGKANGQLELFINGQKIERYISSTLTPDASYTEVSTTVIDLDTDYSALNYVVEVIKRVGIVDTYSDNATNITSLQGMASTGFQAFVDESARLTSVNGTPGSTQFRSTITGRSSIPDLTNDLRGRFGIDRISVQQLAEIQNEFGPNGERVFKAINDDRDLIRFIGVWYPTNDNIGQRARTDTTNDTCEVTFYGTGLNLLSKTFSGPPDVRYSIDGGAENGSSIFVTGSSVLNGRNYSENVVIPVVANQTLGMHTVKLRLNSGTAFEVNGFEIITESSTIKVNPGISYSNGKKLVLASQQSVSYNTTFDSILRDGASVASLSTRGARVLLYQKSDGTVGKSAVETDSAQKNLTLADHTNEELARRYSPREFGAARSSNDDFSFVPQISVFSNRAFTLEDGTTTLAITSGAFSSTTAGSGSGGYTGGVEGLYPYLPSGVGFLTFTFVGTGLDIISATDNSTRQFDAVYIDGGSTLGAVSLAANVGPVRIKICSGLPYGTHTVRFQSPNNGGAPSVIALLVYQPKKPSLPTGATELNDFNLPANYVPNTTASATSIGQGVIRKAAARELTYVGTWTMPSMDTNQVTGFNGSTFTNGSYFEYTFFGTGFDIRLQQSTNWTSNATVQLQNLSTGGTLQLATTANFATLLKAIYGGTGTYNETSTGVWSATQASQVDGAGLSLYNLPQGLWKLRVTNNTTNQLTVSAIDIITPTHSYKSNVYADLQNTLPIGSVSVSDSRKTSAIKETYLQPKVVARAVGIAAANVNGSSLFPMQDMEVQVKSDGAWFLINFSGRMSPNNTGAAARAGIFVDGIQYGVIGENWVGSSSEGMNMALMDAVYLAPGTHNIAIYYSSDSANTISLDSNKRTLIVAKL